MNAVVKAIAPTNTLVRGALVSIQLPELRILVLIFLLLISALGIVYVKDLNRRLFIAYHKLQAQNELLQSDNSKLLLEYSAWAAQARVQIVAQEQLQMQIPPATDVVVIKA